MKTKKKPEKKVFLEAAKRIKGYYDFACCEIDKVVGRPFEDERRFYTKMFSPDGDEKNPFAWWSNDGARDRETAEAESKQHRIISLLLCQQMWDDGQR